MSTLRGSQATLFDVFLRVAGKHILYCRAGDHLDEVRLKKLGEKKVKQLYIRADSEGPYRQYLSRNMELAYQKASGQPIESRALIVQGLQQAATEDVMEHLQDRMNYQVFKDETLQYVDFVLNEDQALRHILAIKNDNSNIAHHGVNVATLAVSLAVHLGHKDATQLQLLATGCLLHDIEHVHTGLNVCRPLSELSADEMSLYRKHPDQGIARVQETKFYDQLVLKIIRLHHEHIDGSGFPDQLKEKDLHPLVLVAAVSDAYDRMISFENVSPKEAIKKLLIDKVGLYPLTMIQGLSGLLKSKGVI